MIALSLDLIHFVIALAFGSESSNVYVYETFDNYLVTVQKALCQNVSQQIIFLLKYCWNLSLLNFQFISPHICEKQQLLTRCQENLYSCSLFSDNFYSLLCP